MRACPPWPASATPTMSNPGSQPGRSAALGRHQLGRSGSLARSCAGAGEESRRRLGRRFAGEWVGAGVEAFGWCWCACVSRLSPHHMQPLIAPACVRLCASECVCAPQRGRAVGVAQEHLWRRGVARYACCMCPASTSWPAAQSRVGELSCASR